MLYVIWCILAMYGSIIVNPDKYHCKITGFDRIDKNTGFYRICKIASGPLLTQFCEGHKFFLPVYLLTLSIPARPLWMNLTGSYGSAFPVANPKFPLLSTASMISLSVLPRLKKCYWCGRFAVLGL